MIFTVLITALPPELLCKIFQYYVESRFRLDCVYQSQVQDDPLERDKYITTLSEHECRPDIFTTRYWALLTLSHVSSAWKTLVEGTPLLWSHIDVLHAVDAKTRLGLDVLSFQTSGSISISLDSDLKCHWTVGMDNKPSDFTPSALTYFNQHLAPQSSRVTHLRIHLPFEAINELFTTLTSSSKEVRPFNSLTSLDLSASGMFSQPWSQDIQWENLACPSLQTLSLKDVPIPPWPIRTSIPLRHLSVRFVLSDDTDTLAALITLLLETRLTLERITVHFSGHGWFAPSTGRLFESLKNLQLGDQVIELPHLQHLRLLNWIGIDQSPFRFLRKLSASPSLCEVQYVGPPSEFSSYLRKYPISKDQGNTLPYRLAYCEDDFSVQLIPLTLHHSSLSNPTLAFSTNVVHIEAEKFIPILVEIAEALAESGRGIVTELQISIINLYTDICGTMFNLLKIRQPPDHVPPTDTFMREWNKMLSGFPALEHLRLSGLSGREVNGVNSAPVMPLLFSSQGASTTSKNTSSLSWPLLRNLDVVIDLSHTAKVTDDEVISFNLPENFLSWVQEGLEIRRRRGHPITILTVECLYGILPRLEDSCVEALKKAVLPETDRLKSVFGKDLEVVEVYTKVLHWTEE